ncbi:MAG: histidine phosphatase family protein [Bacillus sp. (in: Bacteria)]|nr:histidine phosphatase family protein [Bacillus sp. (in: firmicutes)]
MDRSVVVLLLRHGLTEANVSKRYVGWSNPPLCQKGMECLFKTKSKIPHYDTVISSDLARCTETANIYFPNQTIHYWKDLRELNFGEWENHTFEDLQSDPLYKEWVANPEITRPPGGETFADFRHRMNGVIDRLYQFMIEKEVFHVAIVSHGGVLRYWLTQFHPEQKSFWDWKVRHGAGYEFVWKNLDSFRRGERCISLKEVPSTENGNG